jgi:hypothetical protein
MNPSFIVLTVAILGSMGGQGKREVLDVLEQKFNAQMLFT